MPEGTRSHTIDVGYLPELYILLLFTTFLYGTYKYSIEFFRQREGFKNLLSLEGGVRLQTTALESGICVQGFLYPRVPQGQWLRITGQKLNYCWKMQK